MCVVLDSGTHVELITTTWRYKEADSEAAMTCLYRKSGDLFPLTKNPCSLLVYYISSV